MKELSNKKKTYETPQLTVVSFKVERGYAESMTFSAILSGSMDADNGDMEAARNDYDNGGSSYWNY